MSLLLYFFAIVFALCSCTNSRSKELSSHDLNCALPWGGAKLDSAHCELTTNGVEPSAEMTFSIPLWDLKKQNLYFQIKVSHVTSLEGMEVRFFSGADRAMIFNFPLFSDESFNVLQSQEFVTMSIPVSEISKVRAGTTKMDSASLFLSVKAGAAISVALKKVFVQQKKWEKGLVSLSFDDGFSSNYRAAQLAHEMGLQGTAYLIPDAIGTAGYLTESQVTEMKVWGWDLASHHERALTEMPTDEVVPLLLKVQKALDTRFQSQAYRHLAYPMGKQNSKVIEALRTRLVSGRLAGGGTETLPVGDPLRLKAINVLPTMTPQELLEKAEAATKNGEWAIFMFHTLDQPEKGDLDYSSQNFFQFLKKLKEKNISVKKVSEVL